jgi:branched-chain amino acid aminotransferase
VGPGRRGPAAVCAAAGGAGQVITPQVRVNGVPHTAGSAQISVSDRGVTLADGLFETMRARNGAVFRLGQHLARLQAGLVALDFPVPEELERAIREAVGAAGAGEASIRLTVTRGIGPAGLAPPSDVRPTVIIAVVPMPEFPAALHRDGLRAHVASGRRNQHSMTVGLKTVAFTDSVAALLEARRLGADEAVMLDTDGHCSEATASNLFVLVDGTLATPPVSCGALPGITRAVMFELAATLGLRAQERVIELEELAGASEVFLTSSVRGIAPLVRLGDRAIGSGRPGEITRKLIDAYAALVLRECP